MLVIALTLASAIAGALASCHPTGTPGIDAIYGAAVAALVTFAASRSSRSILLIFSAIAVVFSRSWLLAPALVALSGAFASTLQRRSHRRISAAIGAVGVQTILRWPSLGFHGMTAAVAAVAFTLVAASGWRHSRRRIRKISLVVGGGIVGLGAILTLPVVISALMARHPVESGVSLARTALSRIESGDAPAATAELQVANRNLGQARAAVDGWWNLGAYLVPLVAQQERALTDATSAGANLTAVAAANGPKLDLQALRYKAGRLDLAALRAMSHPVDEMDLAVAAAEHELAAARSQWLVYPIADRLQGLSGQIARAKRSVDLAALGIKDLPPILGADGMRHYLVAFMTPAETRGLGGFIGAYGLLTVDHGSITLTASGRTTSLVQQAVGRPVRLTAPADYVARYGHFDPQKYFEDVSYSPDFPTVEQVLAGLYPQLAGVHVDGVMMLDPYALQAMLDFTGPISVPGLSTKLTSANAAEVLLRTQYLTASNGQRHDLLQAALSEGFHRLTTGSLPSPKAMSAALDPVARQGRLMFWSSHPSDQPLLQRLGITGAFPAPAGGKDLLAVTVSNSGNSKIDAYLHQSVSDDVQYNPATGQVSARVTINLHNSAPSSGMPKYVIGNFNEKVIPPGTSYLWLSLYTPLEVQSAFNGTEKTQFSVPQPEAGVNAYSTYVDVSAKSTSTLTVFLSGRIKPGPDYTVTTRLQPLANPQSFTVDAQPAPGWYADPDAATTWTAGSDEVQNHSWAFQH